MKFLRNRIDRRIATTVTISLFLRVCIVFFSLLSSVSALSKGGGGRGGGGGGGGSGRGKAVALIAGAAAGAILSGSLVLGDGVAGADYAGDSVSEYLSHTLK